MVGEIDSKCVTEQSGVIPRSIHTIFEQLTSGKYEDYSVKVSFLELYNEELADLLSDYEDKPSSGSSTMGAAPSSASASDDRKELRIFEDPTGKKGMCVNNLEEALVPNAAAFFTLLDKANRGRKVAETNLNARSSRSHYVVTVTVHMKEYSEDGEDIIKSGRLHLVDLAGSVRHRPAHSQLFACVALSYCSPSHTPSAFSFFSLLFSLGMHRQKWRDRQTRQGGRQDQPESSNVRTRDHSSRRPRLLHSLP